MSVEQDIFVIGVIGSRKNITRMLNAAIHNVVAGEPIVESDDIETTNRKLGYFMGREGHNIGIFDLLDEECMKDEAVIGKKEAFYNRVKACENCPFDCPNSKRKSDAQPLEYGSKEMEEYCPWPDPYDAEDAPTEPNRYIEVVRVEEGTNDYTAKFSWYLYESFSPSDWADWEDIARLYDCRVFVDDDYYRNGEFMRFECATIYEPTEDGVKQTRLESGETRKEYDEFMDKLAELYPERYIPIRERYLKERKEEMAYQREMKRLEEKYQLIEPIHNKTWDSFTSAEEKGIDSVKEVYASCLEQVTKRIAWVDIDRLLQVLMVRAEELKGVNDNLSHCYVDLLRGFRHDYEKKVKELKEQYPKSTIFIDIEPEAWDEQYGWLECYPYEKPEPEVEEETSLYPIDENGHAVIPEGTTEIIEMAFQDCKNLVSVEIPGSVRVINYGAFYGCTGLTSVIIPEGVEEIYDCAFKGCTSLTSVTLPKSIKQVSFDAFDGCPCEDEVYSNLPEDKIR